MHALWSLGDGDVHRVCVVAWIDPAAPFNQACSALVLAVSGLRLVPVGMTMTTAIACEAAKESGVPLGT